MSNSNAITTLQQKHLDDWLLEAWGNYPAISEQQIERTRQCFHAAKSYSKDVRLDLLLDYIERVKRLKHEIITIDDVYEIGIKVAAISIIRFKHDMLAAVIGECRQEAKQ
ncbi:MAG: hypothetical protein K9L22_05245 [Methylococcaceae bacterium]|nr:hypothetical protein [Methylococcaceae bacterium]